MNPDLSKRIEEQLAWAREIEAERKRQNELALAAERANFLAEYAPSLAALRDALPDWAHPYIEAPADWDGYPVVRLPELPVVLCRVKRRTDEIRVEFDSMVYDRWDDSFTPECYWQSIFALAVKSAVDAKQQRDEILASKQRPAQPQPQPSKWANLDPSRKALEAIDNGEYERAQAFGLLAMARELRTIGDTLGKLLSIARAYDLVLAARAGQSETADEVDPDKAGSY